MLIYCEKKKTVLTENWINHVKEVIKNIENLLDIKIERSETNRLVKAHISLTNVTDENLIKCWLFLYDKTGIHESHTQNEGVSLFKNNISPVLNKIIFSFPEI